MEPEDLEVAIKDVLINSELWKGGSPGVCLEHKLVYPVMQERGLLGKKLGLTVKGLAEAKAAYREYWGDESHR